MLERAGVVFEGLSEDVEMTAVPEAEQGKEEDVEDGKEDDGGRGKGREELEPFAEAGGLWQLGKHSEIRGRANNWGR